MSAIIRDVIMFFSDMKYVEDISSIRGLRISLFLHILFIFSGIIRPLRAKKKQKRSVCSMLRSAMSSNGVSARANPLLVNPASAPRCPLPSVKFSREVLIEFTKLSQTVVDRLSVQFYRHTQHLGAIHLLKSNLLALLFARHWFLTAMQLRIPISQILPMDISL